MIASARTKDSYGAWTATLFRRGMSRPVRSIRQFAEELVVLPEGGPYGGQRFRVWRSPWVGLLFDEIDSGRWPEIVATAPAQSGKTLNLFVIPLLWSAAEMRCNCVVGLPDEEMWGDKWAVDIQPVLAASEELAKLLPDRGHGARGGKPKEAVTLTNRSVLKPMTPSGGEHTRSGFTAPVVSITELYRFTGQPFEELKARQGAFNRFGEDGELTTQRRLFSEGTLTSKQELPWTLRCTDDPQAAAISTESEIQSPCPGCGEYQLFDRQHLIGWRGCLSELEAAKAAQWKCPACGHEFGEDERRKSASLCRLVHRGQSVTSDGEVVGDPPPVARLFFRVNAFQNLLVNTSELAAEEWGASQLDPDSPSALDREQYLCTKRFAIPYELPTPDFRPLRASWLRDHRRGSFPVNILPPDTVCWTVGIDLGKFTCWFVAIAFRATGEMCVVKFGGVDTSLTRKDEQGEHVYGAVRGALERILDDLDEGLSCGGQIRQPDLILVDANWFQDVTFDVCSTRGGLPVIGRGKSQFKSREYTPLSKAGGDVKLVSSGWDLMYFRARQYWKLTLDADRSKLAVQAALRVDVGKPGCLALPREIDQRNLSKLCGHLAGEIKTYERNEQGRTVEVWKTTRGRHDLLDCAGYAWVGGEYLGWTPDNPVIQEQAETSQPAGTNYELTGLNGRPLSLAMRY